jgi:hypothetical protein
MLKKFLNPTIRITVPLGLISRGQKFLSTYGVLLMLISVSAISIGAFYFYLQNGLGLSYNDARKY